MTIQIQNNLHTFYDIPTTIYHENISFDGRIEKIGNEIMFDWPNVSLHCHIPPGTTEFYFRGEGINLLKIEIEEQKFPTEMKVNSQNNSKEIQLHIHNPSLTIAKELQRNTISFRNCYCVLSISNQTEMNQRISITKINEAVFGAISFYGVNRQLEKCECEMRKERKKIEIIGDSLSCGYGMFPIRNETSIPLQSDASNSYTSLLSKKFNLENHTIAWSGVGLVRNYDDIIFPNDEHNIEKLWRKTSAGEDHLDYSFEFQPNYVLVNIGHNDFWDVGMQNPFRNDLPEAYIKDDDNLNENESKIEEKEKDENESKIDNEKLNEKEDENNWKSKHILGDTIVDDFILDDESNLDLEFEKKGIEFIQLLLKTYPSVEKIFIVIGPFLPREGEIVWKKVIEQINTIDTQQRCIELNCQLVCSVDRKELWGYRRHPTYLAHQIIYETLLPQIEQYLK